MNGAESWSLSNLLDLAVLGVAGALARTTAQLVAGVKQIAAVAFRNLGLNLPQRPRMVAAPDGRPRLH
jgi:hypothetical protein